MAYMATRKKQAFPTYPSGSYTNRVGCLAWRNKGASAAGVAIKDDCCVASAADGPLLYTGMGSSDPCHADGTTKESEDVAGL